MNTTSVTTFGDTARKALARKIAADGGVDQSQYASIRNSAAESSAKATSVDGCVSDQSYIRQTERSTVLIENSAPIVSGRTSTVTDGYA